jgi:predicted AlkP superfamily phosphohydrolase/phosphomutase
MGSGGRKVLVIGWDSAPPGLTFDTYRREMPTLDALLTRGARARLESTNPPITVPAWTSMMTSKDPGQLGCYGFRNRKDHSYDGYAFATSSQVREPRLWDLLGRAGRRSVVLGVPQTYPPRPMRGAMVTCFLTPSSDVSYTFPESLKSEVERVADGYVFDVENFRTADKHGLLERVYTKTRKHWAVARHLIATQEWDYFMMVEMGLDRMHHGFWSFMDPAHRKYEAGNPLETAIRDYYRTLDAELAALLALVPEDTVVVVVSDHGSKRMAGGICFNEWLMRERFLTLQDAPRVPTPIGRVPIAWDRTRAWGDGGYYGRCFLNVRGREPEGVIDPGDYERVREDLIAGIEGVTDEHGRPLGSRVYRPEEIYRQVRGVAPDLIVYFGDLDWRSVGAVGMGGIHTFENDTGPDEANHDWHGILALSAVAGPGPLHGDLGVVSIYDVAPTLLDLCACLVPDDMIGRSLLARPAP